MSIDTRYKRQKELERRGRRR